MHGNREMRRRRKEYVRKEKASIRRQRKELKKMKRQYRRRRILKWFRAIFNPVGSKKLSTKGDDKPVRLRRKGFTERLRERLKESGKARREKRELRERKRRHNRQLREARKKERQSIARERKMMQEKLRPRRRMMRQLRWQQFKESLVEFLRQPVKVKKLKREEKLLRQAIREELKEQRRQQLQKMPANTLRFFTRSWNLRKDRFRYLLLYLSDSLSGRRLIMESPVLKRELILAGINSTFLFILAFVISYFANRLVTVFTARFFDIPAVLYSYRIFWPLYTYSSLYTRLALIVIFAAGPLFSLISAVITLRIFSLLRFYNKNIKIFLLWFAFHSFNLFFGAYIAGVITRTGFVYTTEWLFYSRVFDVEEIIFVIISAVMLIIIGFNGARYFIQAACSSRITVPEIRLFYMIAVVLLPWFTGLLIIILLNTPKNPPELLILMLTTALMVIPVLSSFNTVSNRVVKVSLRRNGYRLALGYIVLTIVALFLLRMFVYNGVQFKF